MVNIITLTPRIQKNHRKIIERDRKTPQANKDIYQRRPQESHFTCVNRTLGQCTIPFRVYSLLCGQRSDFQIPHSFSWRRHLCAKIFHGSQTNRTGFLYLSGKKTSLPNLVLRVSLIFILNQVSDLQVEIQIWGRLKTEYKTP